MNASLQSNIAVAHINAMQLRLKAVILIEVDAILLGSIILIYRLDQLSPSMVAIDYLDHLS
jgi:hypothetical protein